MEGVALAYTLVTCHFVGDYVLQLDFIAKTKGENWWHLLAHCVTYTAPFAAVFGIDWRIAWLLATHLFVDALKARWGRIGYLTDQTLHLLAMAAYLI